MFSPPPLSRTLTLALALVGLTAACVGDTSNRAIERCVPGLVALCGCPGGGLGTQTCDDDGRYAACVCDGTGDAGTSDVGGTDAGSDAPDAAHDSDLGRDVGDVATPDADVDPGDDTDDADSGDVSSAPDGSVALGAACARDRECESGLCGQFSTGWVCTEPCRGTCATSGWVCFNRVCTPPEHCDLEAGDDGVGPGCSDARCGGCQANSTCTEFEFGRYDCVCNQGWRLEGVDTCVDVDECELGTWTCPASRTCSNTEGGYDCVCGPGYFGEGCAECPGGAASPCFGRGTCDDGPDGDGSCTCSPRYRGELCDEECFLLEPPECADADLDGANMRGLSLVDGDFTNAVLDDLDLENSDFNGADLTAALLQRAPASSRPPSTAPTSPRRPLETRTSRLQQGPTPRSRRPI